MTRLFQIYLLPGAILQSVMIGGGYGTGRELVEYFTRHGMGEGLLGMLVATACISTTFALSLVLARRFQVYDYRSFFRVLLGRGWFLFEVLGVTMFVLVLAVIGAAAGRIMQQELGLPSGLGGAVMLIAVVSMTFFGREWVTRVLAFWSIFLYAVFLAYFVTVAVQFGETTSLAMFKWEFDAAWVVSGFQYALYNVAAVPVILYAARAIQTERQALSAGVLGGVIAMVPGLLFHLSFLGTYPGVLEQELPVYFMFDILSVPVLQGLYLLVLFGTFIETGAGSIQGFIERLDRWWQETRGRTLSRLTHGAVAGVALLLSSVLSAVGVVTLIADGYGTLAWGYLVVFLIPLFTVGVFKLTRAKVE